MELCLVLDTRRFHQECVPTFALQHPIYAFLIALREHRWIGRFHHAPHSLVQTHVRFLYINTRCTPRTLVKGVVAVADGSIFVISFFCILLIIEKNYVFVNNDYFAVLTYRRLTIFY